MRWQMPCMDIGGLKNEDGSLLLHVPGAVGEGMRVCQQASRGR